MAKRRLGSIRTELLTKSREAALNAVQTFNNPLTTFKTETFIVLMVIAWTYLLHAYYRTKGAEYRYYKQGAKRRRFDRTKSGAFKYWELERCLNEDCCPISPAAKSNLRFLIGLRHEIEHHHSAGLDERLTGRYLACCLNYEHCITDIFGDKYSLGEALAFTLNFRDFTKPITADEAPDALPSALAKYLQEFDAALPDEEFQSPQFAYRILFVQKVTSKKGQADRAYEFIPSTSPLAQEMDRQYWVLKEVERKKYRPIDVINKVKEEGYPRFGRYAHTLLWRQLDGKNPGKGYGVEVVPGQWLWYERWVDEVRTHCKDNSDRYGPVPEATK